MIEYIGKCLLITEDKEKLLAIGDLHLAHLGKARVGGIGLVEEVFQNMINEFDSIFDKIGKVNKIVLLGDLKSGFGKLELGERNEIGRIIDYFMKKSEELIVVIGNHDTYVMNVLATRKLEAKKMWKWRKYGFAHGDQKLTKEELEGVENIVIGHIHPAIDLEKGAKRERYKCFLIGKMGKRKLIIVPSFIDVNEGINVLDILEEENEWEINLKEFDVKIVGENLEVYDFGKVKKLI